MKKQILAIVLATVLILAALFCLSGSPQPREEEKKVEYFNAELYGITQTGLLLVTDEQGNLWELEGLNLQEGDKLLITVDNNNTINNKHDDVIINVYVMARPTEAQG